MVGPWFTTLWRLLSQSHEELLSILLLPSSPGSQPRDVPLPCTPPRHPSRPIPRVPRLPILLGLLCGPSHTPFSVPSPSPFIPSLYPTGRPATLWRGLTGSSSIWGPFRVPSTGRSLPAPLHLGGVFLSGPIRGPLLLAPPPLPPADVPIPHLVTCGLVFFCLHAPPGAPPLHRLLLPVPPLPACSVLYAIWRCFVVLISFSVCPPPLSRCASCHVVPSSLHARTSALHCSSGHGSPRCSSPVPSPSLGVALGGTRPYQVGPPPSRHSFLFPLFCPLPSPPP